MPIPRYGRPARFLALALLPALAAAGCGGRGETKAPAAVTPRRGGTAVVGWNGDIKTFNELLVPSNYVTTEVLMRLFLRLVDEQPDYDKGPPTFAPLLARSWEWSADRKALTFYLQPEARWSDGVPVTADDVRFTWQAQTSHDVGWDSANMKRQITDVEVVDPKTARFHFTRAYGRQMTDANEGVILPAHVWGKLPFSQWHRSGDWFHEHLVVDGAFALESWEPHQQVVLKRNEHYFEKGFPLLDRVVVRVVTDQASLMTQLFNGELDFVPQVAPADAARIAADPRLQLLAYWFRLVVAVAWNNRSPLFADPEVRRALAQAIDRQTIVDTLWGKYGRVADSPIVKAVWAHDNALPPLSYDPAAAQRIHAAKGCRDSDGDGVLDRGGKPFAFELISNAGNQQRNDAAVMIQAQLKKVGIKVTPRIIDFGTLVELTDEGRYEAAVTGLGMDTSLDLTGNFHSRSIGAGNGSNFARYSNPEVDRLIDQSLAVVDLKDVRPILDRIQEILNRDQPYTFLWESQRMPAINRRLHDVRPNMLFSLSNIKEWWIEPHR